MIGREAHVPLSHPSPLATLTTERVRSVSLPARRGSVLVDVPRQTVFVMRNMTPSCPAHVRELVRAAVAVKVAATSAVCALWRSAEAAAMLVAASAAIPALRRRSFVRRIEYDLPWFASNEQDPNPT